MPGLSQKEQRRLLDHVEKQGVNVTETSKGYLMRFPDGKTEMLHKSQSDHRSSMNLRAALKRSGISWPLDGKRAELPKYITDGSMRKATLQKYTETLTTLGEGRLIPEITASELARAHWERLRPEDPFPQNTGTVLSTAFKALYHLGYKQTGYRKGKAGFLWELVVPEKPRPTAAEPFAPPQMFAPDEHPAPAPVAQLPVTPAPAPATEEREFIDSHDSWTLDLDEVGEITIGQAVRMMRAAGLQLELRVWR